MSELETLMRRLRQEAEREPFPLDTPVYESARKDALEQEGFFQAWQGRRSRNPGELQTVCQRLLPTNTVPYKPPENKAYSVKVKQRFRPFIEQLLVFQWQGQQIITLGTEAFEWFAPYGQPEEVDEFFRRGE